MIWLLNEAVERCLQERAQLGPDAIIAISPEDFLIDIQTAVTRDNDIDMSDATVEAAAVAEGLADQDGMDYQSGRNWDLYPVRELIVAGQLGRVEPDRRKIEGIVDMYVRQPDNSRTPYTE